MTKGKSEIEILLLNYKTEFRQQYSEISLFKGTEKNWYKMHWEE